MVTLSLADELVLDEADSGLTVERRRVRPASCRGPGRQPGRAGPGRVRPQRHGPPDQAHPAWAADWAGARPTPPPSCAGRAVPIRAWRPGSGRTSPSAWSAAGPGSTGWGSGSPRSTSTARDYLLLLPPFGVDTAGSTGPGTTMAGRDDAPNELTAAALAVEPRLARWRDALGDLAGREPPLAGSGSTWFVEGAAAAGSPARADASGQRRPDWCRPAPCRRAGKGTDESGGRAAGATCRPGAASGSPSASSCASSCASACGAS